MSYEVNTARQNNFNDRLHTSLQERAEEPLISVAILGLYASIADGEPDARELKVFTESFKQKFALSEKSVSKIIKSAVARIGKEEGQLLISAACDTLNEHLDTDQKLTLFDTLGSILVIDGKVTESEEVFFDYIAVKLKLQPALERHLATISLEEFKKLA